MSRSSLVPATLRRRGRAAAWRSRVLAAAVAATLCTPAVQAVTPGHARLLSEPGQPLRLDLALSQLTADELNTLSVRVAPAEAWAAAGLRPPVPLESLAVAVAAGRLADARVVQVRSGQPFTGNVADLLLDIESARGRLRHQVSVLAQADTRVLQAQASAPAVAVPAAQAARVMPADTAQALRVRTGDNLTRLARRHAPAGVSSFQWMVAIWQANPQAFIDNNLNLVRAGASLQVPDIEVMRAMPDREARRIFHDHVLRFAARRGADTAAATAMAAAAVAEVVSKDASRGDLSPAPQASDAAPAASGRDQLRLSEPGQAAPGAAAGRAGAATASSDVAAVGASLPGGVQAATAAQASSSGAASASSSAQADVSGAAPGQAAQAGQAGAAMGAGHSAHGAAGTNAGAGVAAGTSSPASPATGSSGSASTATGASAGGAQSVAEAQERVSQLEANVQKLNQALRLQGEAAHKAVVEGATELTQSLTEVSTAVDKVLSEVSAPSSPDNDLSAALAVPGVSVGEHAAGVTPAGQPAALNATGQRAGGTAAAAQGPTGTAPAPAAGMSSAAGSPSGSGAAASTSSPAASPAGAATEGGSWWSRNLLGLLTALFALAALVVAWVLRRANRRQEELPIGANPITPEQVQRQLDNIDLDLDQPPTDTPRR